MKYLVDGLAIHSDRAAIPSGRRSKRLIEFVRSIGSYGSCIDYGCGKLRHLEVLLENFKRVTLVDSEAQLEKSQIIHGEKTTVRKFCARYKSKTLVYSAEQIRGLARKHDWAFCINVLSAIPCAKTRENILRNIAGLLKSKGSLLVISQFKNSKFEKFSSGKRHLDGNIFETNRGLHFFGRIRLATLKRYLISAGFRYLQIRRVAGYFFVIARLKPGPMALNGGTQIRSSPVGKWLSLPVRVPG